jgi:hypothetical protein
MKKRLLATELTVASMSANAGVITTTGGVSVIQSDFTPASSANLNTGVEFTQWWTLPGTNSSDPYATLTTDTIEVSPGALNAAGSAELVGIGSISVYNGTVTDPTAPTNKPICMGCQLSFSFGGFFRTYDAGTDIALFDTTDAWLNIYLDYDFNSIVRPIDVGLDQGNDITEVNFVSNQVAKAVDGQLWLSLDISNFTYDPNVNASNVNAGGEVGFEGLVNFDPAREGLVTNNIVTDFFTGSYDVKTSGFTAFFEDIVGSGDLLRYAVNGSGNIQARVVSEPGAIALFSLGLIGLGLTARRRMNK